MMSTAELERDVRRLEARVRDVEDQLRAGTARPRLPGVAGPEGPPVRGWAEPRAPRPAAESRVRGWAEPRASRPVDPRASALPSEPRASVPASEPLTSRLIDDLLAGRVLAWVGGIAVCVGLALLLAVAVSHGWLDHSARVGLGAAFSTFVLAAGVCLRERRGGTQASLVAVGAGIAGLFAAITVGAALYHVLPVGVGLGAAALVGAIATGLAIRWSAAPVAALGICGALAAPLLVGAPHDVAPLAFEWIAAVAATVVVTWRRWTALIAAGPTLVLPQWLLFLVDRNPAPLGALAVLVAFGMLGAATAIGYDLRLRSKTLRFAPAFLLGLNSLAIALVGWMALGRGVAGASWLAALAILHAAPALRARGRASDELRLLAVTLAALLFDAAIALTLHGPLLALGWSAAGVAFAALAKRRGLLAAERDLAMAGLGVHVAIALMRALADGAASAAPGIDALLALAAVSAACLASARLQPKLRVVLDALGLATLAGLTAQLAPGPWLAVAWAGEGAALTALAVRTHDRLARIAGLAFLAGAGLHALVLEAPPASLVSGPSDLLAAALALGAVALGVLRAARAAGEPRVRAALGAATAGSVLYLASIAIVSAFQPDGGTVATTVFDLGVRQEGQLLLSAFWAVTGVGALLAGLRTSRRELRLGALALLGLAVGKVFVFDLAILTAGYRVASFLVVGLLLLAAGFAYERLRGGRSLA